MRLCKGDIEIVQHGQDVTISPILRVKSPPMRAIADVVWRRGVRARSAVWIIFTFSHFHFQLRQRISLIAYPCHKEISQQRSNANAIMTKTRKTLRARTQVRTVGIWNSRSESRSLRRGSFQSRRDVRCDTSGWDSSDVRSMYICAQMFGGIAGAAFVGCVRFDFWYVVFERGREI